MVPNVRGPRPLADAVLRWVLTTLAITGGAVVIVIVVFLLIEAVPALRELGPLRFVTDTSWHPASEQFDLTPMLAGTLLTTLGAVLLAGPAGLASALFVHFYAPPFIASPYRTVLEVLAGVPSVVYGFWGLVVLVPFIGSFEPPGASLLAGSLILGLMVLPTVAVIADASIGAVPSGPLRAAAALGLSRPSTLMAVVLPSARQGLATALVLAVGRALGETMAVLMVCGNVVQVPDSLFAPVRTLTANIALEMAYAMGPHRSALFVTGLALMVVVGLLVLLADVPTRRSVRG